MFCTVFHDLDSLLSYLGRLPHGRPGRALSPGDWQLLAFRRHVITVHLPPDRGGPYRIVMERQHPRRRR
jgi:hypothetical protein